MERLLKMSLFLFKKEGEKRSSAHGDRKENYCVSFKKYWNAIGLQFTLLLLLFFLSLFIYISIYIYMSSP